MKKIFSVLFFLFAHALHALPVGNPAEIKLAPCTSECPSFLSCSVGFYGDYVFNRHLQTVRGKVIDTTKLFTNAGYVAVNFFDRWTIFSTLGVTNLSLNTSLGAFNAIDPHPLFEIETESAFSYSIGGRGALFCYKKFWFGLSGRYFSTEPNVKRFYIASGAVSYPGDAVRTHYSEWQVAGGVSYRYNEYFIPYAAVKYAHAFWKLNNGNLFIIEDNTNTHLFNMKNHKHWGYAIGLTLCPLCSDVLAVIAEARFGDEKAFHINVLTLF